MKKLKEIGNRIWKDIRQYSPAAVIFVVYYLIVHFRYGAFCPLLITTGIPCAGCGLTRAGLFLLQGQFERAAYINPSIFPIIMLILYSCFFRYICGKKIKGLSVILGFLIAGMLILYGVRMYLYFPNRIPYIYYQRNVLAEHIPSYTDWIMELMKQLTHPTPGSTTG